MLLRFSLKCIFPLLICLCLYSGCDSSLRYHYQMIAGKTEARPFPLVRYWFEHTGEDFAENVAQVPLVGIPGIIPVGFCLDLIVDTVCSPLDLLMSYFTETATLEAKDEICTIYSARTQLRRYSKHCEGTAAIQIKVLQGSLLIDFKDDYDRAHQSMAWMITPKEIIRFDGKEREPTVIFENNEEPTFRLYCAPEFIDLPDPGILPMLAVTVFCPIDVLKDPRFLFSNDIDRTYALSLFQGNAQEPIAKTWSGNASWRVTFTPSDDFVGSVLHDGKPIKEVLFVKSM